MHRTLLLFLGLGFAATAQDLPAARSREVFLKVCTTCHALEKAVSPGRSREQWQETINAMISRGAKATPGEFAIVLDYLATQYGAAAPLPAGRGIAGRGAGRGGPGPDDKHIVDAAAAERGRKVYAAECIDCHGTHARGTEKGADLIRSVVVLHDRYGNEIGPFLRKGHKTQTTPSANLSQAQMVDLSHFIHQEVYNTLRAALRIQNVLTGDPKAGAAYFTGEGKCATCHSPTGDLSGIGKRLEPAALQQRFLFPMVGSLGGRGRGGRGGAMASKPATVTVTPASGPAVSGALLHIDDFNVALRDAAGEYHSWRRTPSLKVAVSDPYSAHIELLDRITDKNIHDMVAYLETLK